MKMSLSDNIKKFRKKSGFTQKVLASKSGLSFSMISKLESGEQLNPSFQTLKKIATALEINPEKLVNEPIVKAEVYNDRTSDLNFRIKLHAINSIPVPKDDLGYGPFDSICQRPEIKKLLISLCKASKEEVDQIITLIQILQRC